MNTARPPVDAWIDYDTAKRLLDPVQRHQRHQRALHLRRLIIAGLVGLACAGMGILTGQIGTVAP